MTQLVYKPARPVYPLCRASLSARGAQVSAERFDDKSSSCGGGIFSGGSSTHNRCSAHLPHSTSKYLTSFSLVVVGSASFDSHVKPKVRRHRQHRSRSSKFFPLNAGASSWRRSRATYRFATNLNTATFSVSFENSTIRSTSSIIDPHACLPFSPNRTARAFITHFCRKLSGIQTSFDVATETLAPFGFLALTQKAIVLGVPSSFTDGL